MKKTISLTLTLIMILSLAACAPANSAEAQAEKTYVSTDNAPAAIGPYSQAVVSENTIYVAGQIAIDPESGNLIEGSIEDQTKQIFSNIEAVLNAAGFELNDIVRCDVFLKDINDFAAMNEVYANYFEEGKYPARSAMEVANLPKNAMIEIEATAAK